MRITDHATGIRAIKLNKDEVLTQQAIVESMLADGSSNKAVIEEFVATMFDRLEESTIAA
jgi:hypothetical protein